MNQLLRLGGFIPFILVVFLNAFVDLGHKIIIQNTIFKAYDGPQQIFLSALVNALIVLPFILLLSPAGHLSDRYRKPQVLQVSAAIAVLLSAAITLCYYQGWFTAAFALTLLLAVQSAFYSPAKYGLIRELCGNAGLAAGNAAVQATTIVAILAGVLLFSLGFEALLPTPASRDPNELLRACAPLGWALLACSLLELYLCRRIPSRGQQPACPPFDWQQYVHGRYLRGNLQQIQSSRPIWQSIIGLSLFWGISQVIMATFPALAESRLGMTNAAHVQGLLACSGAGILLGALAAGRASRTHIETGLIPLGAVGFVITLLALPQLDTAASVALDLVALGLFGGLFIVPLNALIQYSAPAERLGSVLAGNNWVQNLVMLAFLAATMGLVLKDAPPAVLFQALGVIATVGATYTLYRLPHSLLRLLVSHLLAGRYRVRVEGLNHLPGQGAVLLLGNHISWIDWALVQIASPRPVRFVMHREIYARWYLRWLMDRFGVVPIAPGNSKAALLEINRLLRKGEVVCLFPEGAISRNGQLAEFKRGYERAVEQVDGVIVPFYLGGLWGSRFSRATSLQRPNHSRGLRRSLWVHFGTPLPLSTRAETLKQRVAELAVDSWEHQTQELDTLPAAWIRTVKRRGAQLCLADAASSSQLNGYQALTGALCLAAQLRQRAASRIGLLLPTCSAGLVTSMAGLLAGKTLVPLNYTASAATIRAAIDKAGLKRLYTSRRFLRQLEKRGLSLNGLSEHCQLVFIEDLFAAVSPLRKALTLAAVRLLPYRWLCRLFGVQNTLEQPAAILFSSGSEGSPKGVVLSHRNLMSNIKQVAEVLDARAEDRVMSSLPLFHAFGLTVTSLLPLIEGLPAICHPDPTDSLGIARAIARYRATIFCAPGTFLRLLTRHPRVSPPMLESLRLVVAGAERLQREVRESFELKFHTPVYEGYGATETAPVASVNLPDRLSPQDLQVQQGNRPGSVGLPLPGCAFRIVDPETLSPLPPGEDGMILVCGPQVMHGYLDAPEQSSAALPVLEGRRWYRTGDKGHLDQDGFLTIVDRYSRFAKIGGEMISLGAVEQAIAPLLPDGSELLATRLPDGKKGERVVLLYSGALNPDRLRERIRQAALPPLMQPASLLPVDSLPKLGSGKADVRTATQMALQRAG